MTRSSEEPGVLLLRGDQIRRTAIMPSPLARHQRACTGLPPLVERRREMAAVEQRNRVRPRTLRGVDRFRDEQRHSVALDARAKLLARADVHAIDGEFLVADDAAW